MIDHTASIGAFLEATASAQAMPAAGSCAGIAGALAAALGHMVMSISASKEPASPLHARRGAELAEFAAARQAMTRIIADDQTAFVELLTARRNARADADRAAVVQYAVEQCIAVPEALARAGVSILGAYRRSVDLARPSLRADLSACADLAMAAVRIGVNLMKINAAELSNNDQRNAVIASADDLLRRAIGLVQQR